MKIILKDTRNAFRKFSLEKSFLGNNCLYKIAAKRIKDGPWLQESSWLIGRSYAAPLERRQYSKLMPKIGGKAKGPALIKNAGRGDFYKNFRTAFSCKVALRSFLSPVADRTFSTVHPKTIFAQAIVNC